jgi:hypothetical protein
MALPFERSVMVSVGSSRDKIKELGFTVGIRR